LLLYILGLDPLGGPWHIWLADSVVPLTCDSFAAAWRLEQTDIGVCVTDSSPE
jgi:hypothetical protein